MSRNLMKNLAFILAWPLALCALSLTSCGSGADGDYATQLKQYFDKDVETADGTGAMSAYFDLSDGMVLAYKGNADAAGFLNAKYGQGTVELTIRDSYFNMKKCIEENSTYAYYNYIYREKENDK